MIGLIKNVEPKFYAIADLAKDGFVHADGSLRFEFKIKKHNQLRFLIMLCVPCAITNTNIANNDVT